jgi:hypothetical protein
MTTDQKEGVRVRPGVLAAGAVLMAIGIGSLLDSYGVLSIHPSRLIGPFVLIALGTSTLFTERRRGAFGSAWLIGVGCWLLISQTNMFGLTFGTSWPLLLILAGALISIRGWR